jgi:salicylate hydroxylase
MLPNATRLLRYWGVEEACSKYAGSPAKAQYFSWKGEPLTSMDFDEAGKRYGSPFWDFHRANLHSCLVDRATELGAKIQTNSRVEEIECSKESSTVVLTDGRRLTADLVVGADGIASRTRECFLERNDPPTPTGDLAYRVLLKTSDFAHDKELEWLMTTSQVNYWMGPDCKYYIA